jgi:hypothetical protein
MDGKKWFLSLSNVVRGRAVMMREALSGNRYRYNCSTGDRVALFFPTDFVAPLLNRDLRFMGNGSAALEASIMPSQRGDWTVAVVRAPDRLVTTRVSASLQVLQNAVERFKPLHMMSVRVTPPHAAKNA